jgi:hypothetical protein
MRLASVLCLTLLLAAAAPGQNSGFGNVVFPGRGHAPVGRSEFGNVVFPGGTMPRMTPFSITNPSFANRLGGSVSGFRPFTGAGRGHGRGGVVYLPYAYPVLGGGYFGTPYQQQPNVTVIYAPPQPPVIVNQTFTDAARPAAGVSEPEEPENISVYQAPSRAATETEAAPASYYLIAFKDHSIYSAVAYWVEGDTLHYFTAGNTRNQASLSLVDQELTERLNRERNVQVKLPK